MRVRGTRGAWVALRLRRRCLSVGLPSSDRFEGYERSVVAIEEACSIPNLRRLELWA